MRKLALVTAAVLAWQAAAAQQAAIPPGFTFSAITSSDTLSVSTTSSNVALTTPGPLVVVTNQTRDSVCVSLGSTSSATATWPCSGAALISPGQSTILPVTASFGGTPYLAGISAPGGSGGTLSISEGYLKTSQAVGATPLAGAVVGTVAANYLAGDVRQPAYGAKCDGKQAPGLSITASQSVTSGYTFSQSDVGKLITIPGAGTTYTTTGTASGGSFVITVPTLSGTSAYVGQYVYGTNIPAGDRVVAVASTTSIQIGPTATSGSLSSTAISLAGPLNATIQSVSGGNATLSATAGSTATSVTATYGTPDDVAINLATGGSGGSSGVALAGGGVVSLPTATCIASSPIFVTNNVSITGQGPGKSVLKWISTGDQPGYGVIMGWTGVVTCTSTIAATYSNIQVTNLEVDGSAATDATYAVGAKGISLPCNQDSLVDNVYVHDTPATCIATDFAIRNTTSRFEVANCGRMGAGTLGSNGVGDAIGGLTGEAYSIGPGTVSNASNFGVLFENQTATTQLVALTVSDVHVFSTQQYTGGSHAGISLGALGGTVTANTVQGPNVAGTSFSCISVDGGTVGSAAGAGVIISANDVGKCHYGIIVNYGNVPPKPNSTEAAVSIVGNHAQGNNVSGIAIIANASVAASTFNVNSNIMAHNQSSGFFCSGAGGVSNLKLNSNIAFDNGSTASGYQKAGFAFNCGVTRLEMSANTAFDDATPSAYQSYGLSVNTGMTITSADITDNNFVGNVTSALDILGTITGRYSGNLGMPSPSISGCTATGATGDGDAGTYTSGTTGTCAVTVTPFGTSNVHALNGWVGSAFDATTTADTQLQTASTASTATFSGTTVSGDVINFSLKSW